MTSYNYRYLRGRFKPRRVQILPAGEWVKVKEASLRTGLSTTTIYLWCFLDRVKSLKLKGKTALLVDFEGVKARKTQ